jgi:uncharacterized protein (TIGR00297 family)
MDSNFLTSHLIWRDLAVGGMLSLLIALAAFRLKALTGNGATGTVLIGTIVFGFGGILFAVPLIFFFVSSNLLSAIRTARKDAVISILGKSGPRDLKQVLANGAAAAAMVPIYAITGEIFWFFLYLAAVAEAAADTWATELGTLSKYRPISIVTFRKVDPGLSGGVTALGTLGAIGGAAATVGSGYLAIMLMNQKMNVVDLVWPGVTFFGFVGSLIDSIIGGAWQGQYRCVTCGRIIEKTLHCGRETTLCRGFRFIGNDLVNFLSTVSGILMAGLFLRVLIRL